MASLLETLGATITMYLVLRGVLWGFRKIQSVPDSIVLASLVALCLLTLVGGYGMADDKQHPAFFQAFLASLIPAVLAMSIELGRTRLKRRSHSDAGQDAGPD